ncbi:MAG TPA: hypothetical protein VGH66_12440 [Acidimicrobiales bacterium]|jgi:uncharacterized membrane protein
MFYIIIFAGLAILLIIAFITVGTRRRRDMENYEHNNAKTKAARRERNAERKQSRTDRRKRR